MLSKANISQLLTNVDIETKNLWGENMKTDNGYPYNFDLQKIEEMVNFFLAKDQHTKALDELDIIQTEFFKYKDKIDLNKPENEHLMGYILETLNPDIFELELSKIIQDLKAGIGSSDRETSAIPKDGATIDKLALLLFFSKGEKYNPDFEKIAKDYHFKNGKKLSKTFSVFTKQIRRMGPCKELESHTQKLNRIEEYKWAIDRLPLDKKQLAIDEMKTLVSKLTVEE